MFSEITDPIFYIPHPRSLLRLGRLRGDSRQTRFSPNLWVLPTNSGAPSPLKALMLPHLLRIQPVRAGLGSTGESSKREGLWSGSTFPTPEENVVFLESTCGAPRFLQVQGKPPTPPDFSPRQAWKLSGRASNHGG